MTHTHFILLKTLTLHETDKPSTSVKHGMHHLDDCETTTTKDPSPKQEHTERHYQYLASYTALCSSNY
jgi:hypothetical protein